jgi:hypothetical protein
MLELDAATHGLRQLERLERRLDRRLRLCELDEPLHGTGGALHLVPHFRERGGRHAHVACVDEKLAQLAERHAARQHAMRPDPEHERDGAEYQHRRECRQPTLQPDAPHGHRERVLHGVAKPARLQGLEVERLHRLHGIESFARERARVRHAILRIARQAPQAAAEHQ